MMVTVCINAVFLIQQHVHLIFTYPPPLLGKESNADCHIGPNLSGTAKLCTWVLQFPGSTKWPSFAICRIRLHLQDKETGQCLSSIKIMPIFLPQCYTANVTQGDLPKAAFKKTWWRRTYPTPLGAGGVGSIHANSDAQNVPSFRRWQFVMKLSPFLVKATEGACSTGFIPKVNWFWLDWPSPLRGKHQIMINDVLFTTERVGCTGRKSCMCAW